MIPAPELTNAPEWSVSELAGALRRTLEDAFGHVRLRAELGKVSRHSSGHVYLDLKDDGACIAGVIWRTAGARLKVKLEQGMEVIVTGRITTFPGASKYQIVIDTIEPAGIGALMALLDERRRRLAAEGLFATERKRPLPFLPGVVGVVTSPTGAVIRDILHRLEDRFPRHVIVWPVRVQGDTCGAEVAAAIAGLNALPAGGRIPRPDVIIVARGGGSLEDLWGFNDEAVVRAAAASAVPLIAAVGHETDWTLLDHAADVRAPTPTGAAEMAVPVRSELIAQVGGLARRLADAARRGLDGGRDALRSAARALPTADGLLAAKRQRLDLAGARLPAALLANARDGERRVKVAAAALGRQAPLVRLALARGRLDAAGAGLPRAVLHALTQGRKDVAGKAGRLTLGRDVVLRAETLRLGRCRERLGELSGQADRALRSGLERRFALVQARSELLASLGYRSVLERGYALVRDEAGRPVPRAAAVMPGDTLAIDFADGRRAVSVEGRRPEPERTERPKRRPGAGSREAFAQESLFDL